ncbi:MAG: hypothetical protein EBS86_17550 [Crocinitomicaceae bacterium]|nr:hypothetical protein [Crocinitomicaceae bacterium]
MFTCRNKNLVESFSDIDAYIASQTLEWQEILQKVRRIIQEAAPNATEAMKYGMPTFVYKKNLVHFAACKSHLGFYPTPSGIEHFSEELAAYKTTKGAIQFPLNQEIPYDLIAKITAFRVQSVESK